MTFSKNRAKKVTTSKKQHQCNSSDTITQMHFRPFLIQAGFRFVNINLWLKARKKLFNVNASVLSLLRVRTSPMQSPVKISTWNTQLLHTDCMFANVKTPYFNPPSIKTVLQHKIYIPMKHWMHLILKTHQLHTKKCFYKKTVQAQRWLTFYLTSILGSQRHKLRTCFPLTSPNIQSGWRSKSYWWLDRLSRSVFPMLWKSYVSQTRLILEYFFKTWCSKAKSEDKNQCGSSL